MADFRYTGVNTANKRIIGYVSANNKQQAKERVHRLAARHNFSVKAIHKKNNFVYTVKNSSGQKNKGEIEAFSKDEVENALRRAGYTEYKVERSLLSFNLKPSFTEIITFVRLSADLLREKLPFDEIMQLMEIDFTSKPMKTMIRQILSDLKEGKDGEEIFARQEVALGKFAAKMLGIASKSGDMAAVYENTAKFLERDQEFRKNLRSALMMPTITMFILFGAVIFYVGYIFPKTAELFQQIGVELPPMTAWTLEFSHFLTGNILWILLAVAIPPLALFQYSRTEKGKMVVDKFIIRMPVVGSIMHKTSIEIFCRVFFSMYSGSGENIEVIRTAAEACRNKYIEKQIKEVTIPMMLTEGKSFIDGLKAADVFTENALTRFNTGAESGTLKKVAQQIASYYERETTYKMKNLTEWIQIIIAMVMMIVITALTIVSSETAVVQPKMPGTN